MGAARRGETRFGSEPLQNAGSTAGARRRGGVVIPRTLMAEAALQGAAAATAANYGIFYTCPPVPGQLEPDEAAASQVAYEVDYVVERHEVLGTDAGAVTLMVKKVPSGTAKAAGTDLLSAGISLKSAVDINNVGALHGTLANIQLNPGDSLALVPTGVLTAVAGLSVQVQLRRI